MGKKSTSILTVFALSGALILAGCGNSREPGTDFDDAVIESTAQEKQQDLDELFDKGVETLETIPVPEGETLGYIQVVDAAASSFDQTPDWAPAPDPMAAADGDMLTRWSSDYTEGPQWIYFDLGTESVVSDIIIRWERAYATDYKVMGSMDAETWQELVRVKDGKGGTAELSFASVKARYIKVLGLERVNEDWGISIWETEIFGPVSKNPHVLMTREEYLVGGDEQGKREEADALLASLASDPVPLSEMPFQKGVVYTSWMGEEFLMPASDIMLAYLKQIGFDTVGIMVPAYQETVYATEIYTNDTPDGDTPTDEALERVMEVCRKLGLRVMLKPHIDPRTHEPRINIMPSEEWFDNFEEFTLRYARMAEKNNAEMFCIGTELEATTFSAWDHRWNQLIDKVREEYSGIITYAANWTEFEDVSFWDRMDFIGIDAYFPLANMDDPSLEDLINSWTVIADRIEAWREEKGLTDKAVVLTEIGYPSARGAARQPWVALTDIEDQQAQADAFEAMFTVLTERDWFEGYHIWQYFPQDRWSPLGFTVKGKKAEEVIKTWLE